MSTPAALACEGWPASITTRYTTICYFDEKGLQKFTNSIGKGGNWITLSPLPSPLRGEGQGEGGTRGFSSESTAKNLSTTKERVDLLVEKVNKLLDMYPPDIHFRIYVHQNHKGVENSYTKISTLGIFGRIPVAFYSHKNKAVYVSLENISAGILAHEIAHAVINFYFPEPPPERMQEILAQYVDKHLWE